MKTRFFGVFDVNDEANKEFSNDFKALVSIEKEKLRFILDGIIKIISIRTELALREECERIVRETGIIESKVQKVINITKFLMRKLQKEEYQNDTPVFLVEDLIETSIITTGQKECALEYFEQVIKMNKLYAKNIFLRDKAESGVLPKFDGIGTTVELRAIVENKYRWGQNISIYEPELNGLVPIISIAIRTDVEEAAPLVFQISMDDLGIIIDQLLAARKEVDAMNKYIVTVKTTAS